VAQSQHFVQVVRGQVSPSARDDLRGQLDRWASDLAPGADGWLGSTAGVTEDGAFFAAARFASERQARANSDRPEQHQWWMETAKLFEGEVTFADCTDAETIGGGGSDDAGFVQVIAARVADIEEMRRLGERMEQVMAAGPSRDDVIGGLYATHDGDRTVQIIYFTSEAAAREGEQADGPPEVAEVMSRMQELMSDVTYTDLTDPWMHSPR
jgi:hypothetical protein